MRELIGEVLVAPVQPWDALICTSPSVRDCLEQLFDHWEAYLLERFGGTRYLRPQLPLLPLGVNQGHLLAQRSDQRSRDFLRNHLGCDETDVLVLWVGRLSFSRKLFHRVCLSLSKSFATFSLPLPFCHGWLVSWW